jgi:uracil-DNA glycosylase
VTRPGKTGPVPEEGAVAEGATPASQLARFLHQRMERGEGMLVLDSLTRREVGGLVKEGRKARPAWPSGTRPQVTLEAASTGVVPPGPGSPVRGRNQEDAGQPVPSVPAAARAPLPTVAAPAATAASDLRLPPDLDAVRGVALGCTRCRLSETRTSVVFSDGVPSPRVLILGEAPGQNEDETGLPFVGAAGRLLDLLLASIGISRKENAYICNVLKCRPPGNRNPLPDEIACCTPFLKSQLTLVAPEAILAVGTFAGQWVTGEERPLGKLRGSVYSYEGIPVVVTYHPAALLRNSGWTRSTWDDLQLLRSVLDGG